MRRVIREIISHFSPHPDEYLAEVLARRFGQEFFKFIPFVTYSYISSTAGNLASENPHTLHLGVGGGPFDDHGARHTKSCSELMAEYLGISKHPAVIKLLQIVTHLDKERSGSSNTFTVQRITNQMHRYAVDVAGAQSWTADEVRLWVCDLFNAIIDSEEMLAEEILPKIKYDHRNIENESERKEAVQKAFLKIHRDWKFFTVPACSKLLGKRGKDWLAFAELAAEKQTQAFLKAKSIASGYINEIETPQYGKLRILTIDGTDVEGTGFMDCEVEFDAVSRSLKVDVVYLRSFLGQNFIGVNPTFKGNLEEVVVRIRRAEARKLGIEIPPFQLAAQGTIAVLPQWHVHEMTEPEKRYRRMYNGSTTRPHIERTLLTFQEIREIIMSVLMMYCPVVSVGGGVSRLKKVEITPDHLDAFLHPEKSATFLGSYSA